MTQPTWTKIDGGLPPNPAYKALEPDPFDPAGRQYLLANNEVYVRTGGNWSEIATGAYAGNLVTAYKAAWAGYDTLFGSDIQVVSIQADINTDGYLALWAWGQLANPGYIGGKVIYFHSDDYGATWDVPAAPTSMLDDGDNTRFGEVGDFLGGGYAAGQILYKPSTAGVSHNLARSLDKGEVWTYPDTGTIFCNEAGAIYICFNTDVYQNIVYALRMGGAGNSFFKRSIDSGTTWTGDLLGGSYSLSRSGTSALYRYSFHALLGDSSGADVIRIVLDDNSILKTTDGGVNWTQVAAGPLPANTILGISLVHDADGKIYGLDISSTRTVNNRAIWVSDNEGATWSEKAGANAGDVAGPWTDSIPWSAKVLAIVQIWN